MRQQEEVNLVLWLGCGLVHDDVEHPGRDGLLQQGALCVAARVAAQEAIQRATLHFTGEGEKGGSMANSDGRFKLTRVRSAAVR